MDGLFQVLAEPRRLEILRLVRDRELSVGAIASRFDVSRPAISQHLRVLMDAGLVTRRKDGTHRFYRLRKEGLGEMREFIRELAGTAPPRAAPRVTPPWRGERAEERTEEPVDPGWKVW